MTLMDIHTVVTKKAVSLKILNKSGTPFVQFFKRCVTKLVYKIVYFLLRLFLRRTLAQGLVRIHKDDSGTCWKILTIPLLPRLDRQSTLKHHFSSSLPKLDRQSTSKHHFSSSLLQLDWQSPGYTDRPAIIHSGSSKVMRMRQPEAIGTL